MLDNCIWQIFIKLGFVMSKDHFEDALNVKSHETIDLSDLV